jgi:hypothetical protein
MVRKQRQQAKRPEEIFIALAASESVGSSTNHGNSLLKKKQQQQKQQTQPRQPQKRQQPQQYTLPPRKLKYGRRADNQIFSGTNSSMNPVVCSLALGGLLDGFGRGEDDFSDESTATSSDSSEDDEECHVPSTIIPKTKTKTKGKKAPKSAAAAGAPPRFPPVAEERDDVSDATSTRDILDDLRLRHDIPREEDEEEDKVSSSYSDDDASSLTESLSSDSSSLSESFISFSSSFDSEEEDLLELFDESYWIFEDDLRSVETELRSIPTSKTMDDARTHATGKTSKSVKLILQEFRERTTSQSQSLFQHAPNKHTIPTEMTDSKNKQRNVDRSRDKIFSAMKEMVGAVLNKKQESSRQVQREALIINKRQAARPPIDKSGKYNVPNDQIGKEDKPKEIIDVSEEVEVANHMATTVYQTPPNETTGNFPSEESKEVELTHETAFQVSKDQPSEFKDDSNCIHESNDSKLEEALDEVYDESEEVEFSQTLLTSNDPPNKIKDTNQVNEAACLESEEVELSTTVLPSVSKEPRSNDVIKEEEYIQHNEAVNEEETPKGYEIALLEDNSSKRFSRKGNWISELRSNRPKKKSGSSSMKNESIETYTDSKEQGESEVLAGILIDIKKLDVKDEIDGFEIAPTLQPRIKRKWILLDMEKLDVKDLDVKDEVDGFEITPSLAPTSSLGPTQKGSWSLRGIGRKRRTHSGAASIMSKSTNLISVGSRLFRLKRSKRPKKSKPTISNAQLDLLGEALAMDCVQEQGGMSSAEDSLTALTEDKKERAKHSLRSRIQKLDLKKKTKLIRSLTKRLKRSQLKRLVVSMALAFKQAETKLLQTSADAAENETKTGLLPTGDLSCSSKATYERSRSLLPQLPTVVESLSA